MRVNAETATHGITRPEILAAIGETLGLFCIFLVAFTGRDQFGDTITIVLIALTLIVGGLGVAAGIAIARRGLLTPHARAARLALGAFMVFIGAYSILHVVS